MHVNKIEQFKHWQKEFENKINIWKLFIFFLVTPKPYKINKNLCNLIFRKNVSSNFKNNKQVRNFRPNKLLENYLFYFKEGLKTSIFLLFNKWINSSNSWMPIELKVILGWCEQDWWMLGYPLFIFHRSIGFVVP